MNSQSDLVEAIDDLLTFIRACGAYRDVQEIPPDGLAEFYRLDQRVYDLTNSVGLLDRIPDRSALDREWNVDGVSVPVRFEGKTNLPADWDNNALMVYAKGGWTADMLALRTIASIGLIPAVPSSDPPADTETPAPPEAAEPVDWENYRLEGKYLTTKYIFERFHIRESKFGKRLQTASPAMRKLLQEAHDTRKRHPDWTKRGRVPWVYRRDIVYAISDSRGQSRE